VKKLCQSQKSSKIARKLLENFLKIAVFSLI
jgi:hypothetical protein